MSDDLVYTAIEHLVNDLEDASEENRFNDANKRLLELTSPKVHPRLLVCGLRYTSKWPLHLVPCWNSALSIARQKLIKGGYDVTYILRGLNEKEMTNE